MNPLDNMIIEVTQNDIDRGDQGDPGYCPIACALRRRFDAFISVGASTFTLDCFNGRLPKAAQEFVVRFDRGRRVKPFRFKLPKLRPPACLKRQWEQKRKQAENPSPEAIESCLASLSAGNDKPSDVLISS